MRQAMYVLAIVVAVCFPGGTAYGQIEWEAPVLSLNGSEAPWDIVPSSNVAITATEGGFTLTGDVNLTAPLFWQTGDVYILGVRRFDVGPIPVEASLDFAESFKAVVGGGTLEEPILGVTRSVQVYEIIETEGGMLAMPLPVLHLGVFGLAQVGNGYVVHADEAETGNYVLASGRTYEIRTLIQMTMTEQPLGPVAVGTLEFGGITSFDGFSTSMTYQLVPEPTSLALLVMGAVLLRRRPHRR